MDHVSTTEESMFERVDAHRSPKLTAVVSDMLRRKILTGELSEGDNLPPEPELMAQLGVSRPTLREALRVLESEALIRPRRGSRTGAEVCAPSAAMSARYMSFVLQHEGVTVDDVVQARVVVEPPLAALVSKTKSARTMKVLRDALAAEEASLGDNLAFGEASLVFHETVADLSGAPTLALCVRQFNWVLGRLTREVEEAPIEGGKGNLRAHRAHQKFVDLLESASPDEMERYWRDHVEAISKVMLRSRRGTTILDLFS